MPSTPDGSSSSHYASDAMPTVGRVNGMYVVCDPTGAYTVDIDTGKVTVGRHPLIRSLFGIAGGLTGGVWLALSASPWGWAIPLFVVGAVCGFIAGALVSLPLVGASWAIQFLADLRHGRPRSIKGIDDTSSQAWRLCDLAWRIGRVGSWRDRTVDPERRVASIVWSAVERSLAAESQHADAVRALDHPNLKTLAESMLARIEQERRSLSAVESNLQKVLDTARGIDCSARAGGKGPGGRATAARRRTGTLGPTDGRPPPSRPRWQCFRIAGRAVRRPGRGSAGDRRMARRKRQDAPRLISQANPRRTRHRSRSGSCFDLAPADRGTSRVAQGQEEGRRPRGLRLYQGHVKHVAPGRSG